MRLTPGGKLIWAMRTALTAAFSFWALMASEQTIFPITVLGIVVGIVVCGSSIGSTLVMFRVVSISAFIGSVFGGVVSNAFLSNDLSTTVKRVLLPVLVGAGCAGLTRIPRVPSKGIACLLYILSLLPFTDLEGTKQWYFAARILGTMLIGCVIALACSFLPWPAVGSAWLKADAQLLTAQSLTVSLLTAMQDVLATNSAASVARTVALSRKLEMLCSREVVRLSFVSTEINAYYWIADLFCCGTRAKDEVAMHVARVRFLQQQVQWLRGMCQASASRSAEALTDDQRVFIRNCDNAMREAIGIANTALPYIHNMQSSVTPAAAIELSRRLDIALRDQQEGFRKSRQEVIYSVSEGKSVMMTPDPDEPAGAKATRMTRRHKYLFNFTGYMRLVSTKLGAQDKDATLREISTTREAEAEAERLKISKKQAPVSPVSHPAKWTRPVKLGSTLAIASLWLVVPALQYQVNAIWTLITICFVAQTDVGASLAKVLNRLIGTVMSCAACLLMHRISLAAKDDTLAILASLMCIFVFCVSLFRDHPEHGYAALTAAFTTPVLLFGDVADYKESEILENNIVARVELTMIGVALYMFIECTFWPVRPRAMIRNQTSSFFVQVSSFLRKTNSVVHALLNDDIPTMPYKSISIKSFSSRLPVAEESKEDADGEKMDSKGDTEVLRAMAIRVLFTNMELARKTAHETLNTAKSFLAAASNQPNLGFQASVFPTFEWEELQRAQGALLFQIDTLARVVKQLEPALENQVNPLDRSSLVAIGLKSIARTSRFLNDLTAVLTQFENLISPQRDTTAFSLEQHDHIVRILSVFRTAPQVDREMREYRTNFMRKFLQQRAKRVAETENDDTDMDMLQQENQVLLATLGTACLDIVAATSNLGKILESIWL